MHQSFSQVDSAATKELALKVDAVSKDSRIQKVNAVIIINLG